MLILLSKFRVTLILGLLILLPLSVHADKVQPVVTGSWQGAPSTIPLGKAVDLILRFTASADVADVAVEVLPNAGFEIASGTSKWTGEMTRGQTIDLPFTVRFIANGDWTLGASLTARDPGFGDQGSGAVLYVIASGGIATISPDHFSIMRLNAAKTEEDLRKLGVGREQGNPGK